MALLRETRPRGSALSRSLARSLSRSQPLRVLLPTHSHTVSVPSDADVVEAGPTLGSQSAGAVGDGSAVERRSRAEGAHNRLINGPRVTAIKVACQWRGSEAQRRSAMIEEPSFSAAALSTEHGKAFTFTI
ncbi:uncharacterized protein V6R79_010891 [Siganus canaliculatus]